MCFPGTTRNYDNVVLVITFCLFCSNLVCSSVTRISSSFLPTPTSLGLKIWASPWKLQAFTNFVHGYDRARNLNGNGVTRTQKVVHGIDSSA